MSSPARRLLVAGVLAFVPSVGVAAATAACGSFGSTDPVPTVAEEAGLAEAGALEGGALDDGPTSDSGVPCSAAPCVFDFEDGKPPAGWETAGNPGIPTVSEGLSVSGTHSLGVELVGALPSYLVFDLGKAQHVAVTASVLVIKRGDGEVDFIGLSSTTTAEPGLYLVHQSSTSKYVTELPESGSEETTQTFTSYTSVRLEVDLAKRTYAYKLGTDVAHKGNLVPAAFPQNRLYVLLGAPYALGVKVPWVARFDDVKIETF